MLPNVPDERRVEVQKQFYTTPYESFVPYGIHTGLLNEAATVIEAFLQKKKRNPVALSSVWRTVDCRCKLHANSFSVMPDIQWETSVKVRIALWDNSDVAVFIVKVPPQLSLAGFSMTDERTGTWIDEREVMSVHSGSSAFSSALLPSATGESEPVVLVDVPDHLLKADV